MGLGESVGGGSYAAFGNSSALMNIMLGLGEETWTNTEYGFESNSHIFLIYNVSYQILKTFLDSFFNIPEVVLSGNSSDWESQMQGSFNAFMNNWYGPGGKGNFGFGTAAATIGFVQGSFRFTNFSNGWNGSFKLQK